ncbi:MAG: hypothetical protein V4735_00485 [Pseudomonadota bacterium]
MLKKILFLLLPIFMSFAVHAQDLRMLKPAAPGDNDRLIAQYMSSKDTIYIRHMLDAYAEADDGMLKDARRFAYLSSQFKNPKSPRPGLAKTVSTAVCKKYDCASRSARSTQFMTIASGMWALDSLSKQHPPIKETVERFLNSNERMKQIYAQEGALFSNYWTLTIVSIAQPDKLDAPLTTYEQLGPLDTHAVMKSLEIQKATP